MLRKAPIGASLTVAAPMPLYVDVSAKVFLGESENIDTVTARFKTNLDKYWLQAASENDLYDVFTGDAKNCIKYVFIGAALAETAGVTDYCRETLFVNGGMENILINFGVYPVTRDVNLYE